SGEAGRPPRAVPLNEPFDELPMAVSLENRTTEVGRAALALERKTPHLTAFDFLHDLNQPRRWEAGRHSYSATDLLVLVLAKARAALPRSENLTLTLPVYLTPPKITTVAETMQRCKLPVRGSVLLPLALAGVAELPERRQSVTLI